MGSPCGMVNLSENTATNKRVPYMKNNKEAHFRQRLIMYARKHGCSVALSVTIIGT